MMKKLNILQKKKLFRRVGCFLNITFIKFIARINLALMFFFLILILINFTKEKKSIYNENADKVSSFKFQPIYE